MGSYLSRSSLFYKLNLKPHSVKPALIISFLLLLLIFIPVKLFAVSYVWNGATSVAWATTTNWTPNGNPGSAVGDIVSIPAVATQPTLSITPANSLASLTIDAGSTLTIGAITLTISGDWTNNGTVTGTSGRLSASTGICINNGTINLTTGRVVITTGSLTNDGSIAFSSTGRITQTSGTITNTVNGTISVVGTGSTTFSTGDFINNNTSASVNLGSTPITVSGTAQSIGGFTTTGLFSCTSASGTVTLTGDINATGFTKSGAGTLNLGVGLNHTTTGVVTLTAGTLNGGSSTLNVNIVSATAWNGTGTVFNAGTGTVNFGAAGNQTLSATGTKTFYNLTFSNSGTKTNASTTVNNVFSLEGTATASAAPTYGAAATLQYNTTAARTAGAEWITPFVATGGVIIANTGAINPGANKVFNLDVPLTINALATFNAATRTFSFGGDFINNGTWTASTGAITIALTRATQSIGAFVTTALVSMTKTGGTATFQGNVGGAGLTINGVGGTLNLGASLTHTFTGDVALTNGILNGGSSTLNVNIVSATAWSGTGTKFTAGTGTVNFGAAGNQTLSATSTAFNNLTFSNSGTKTLSTNNTVSANLTVRSGITLALGTSTLGTPTSVTLETVGLGNGSVISGSGQFTIGGDVTVNYTGAGAITTGASIVPPIAMGGATRTFTVVDDVNSTTTEFSMTGIISATGAFGITKAGDGTLLLSGSSTYTGLTTISAGTLKLGATGGVTNTPLGTSGTGTSVTAGAVLDLAGFTLANTTTFEELTLNGTGMLNSGALMNSGAAATYSGLLTLGSASSIKGGTGTIAVSNVGTITGLTFLLTLGGAQGGSITSIIGNTSGGVTKEDAGTWNLSGVNTYTGATTVNGGTLKAGVATQAFGVTSAVTLANTALAILDITGFSNTIGSLTGGGATGGNVTLGAATLTIGSDNTSPAAYAGIISGTGAIIKSGTGTLILSGSNTFSGLTTIDAGTLKLGSTGDVTNTPLGTTAAGTIISATGAALDLAGFTLANTTTFEALTLNGTGIALGGALMNSGAAATYSGLITLGSSSSILGGAGTIAISHVGTITGSGFGLTLGGAQGGSVTSIIGTVAGAVTKEDAGTWTLSGANTYSGGTNLNAGQLNIDHLTAIGSGALTISANTIIDNTSGGAIGPLTNNNAQIWNGNFTFTGTNDLNVGTGAITMGADVTITSSSIAKTLTIGGVNNNGVRSLTKAGAGNLIFGSAAVTLLNFTISAGTLTATSGDLFLAGNFSNNSTFTHNSGTVTFNGTVAQSVTSGGSSFNNLTISGTGGVVASSDFTVDGVLNLQSANVSATQGCLEMSTFTLNMGATATTAGTGDVTGIVQRTSFVANTSYSFGNTYTTLNLVNVGVLPTMVSFKIVLTSTHTWKTDAIHRYYDIIQAGCDATSRITLNLHYLDSELNGANESDLDMFNYFVSTTVLGERGASNVSSTDNWVGLSGLGMLYTAGLSFGQKYWTIGPDVNGDNITWIGGSESGTTDWTLPGNWSGGVPTATSLVHIPGSLTYYPVLPTNTTIGNILIQSGAIVNGTTGAPVLTIALGTGAWNNQGTFNAGISTVIFTNVAATMSGTTDFYNVTVADGAALELTTNTVMRIAGILSLSTTGTLSAANDTNTVEYNGTAQTVVFPNGTTPGYWNLTLSTSGIKTMPSSAINLYGDFAMSGTASTTALGAITTAGNFTVGAGTSFTTGAFTHTIGGNFLNDGTFDATGSTIIMNGTLAQSITGASVSFNNLTISNTSAVVSANNDINVGGTFTTNVSTILDMGTSALSVNTVAHSGTLKTQNTSATPITAAKTWGGQVDYNGASNQTVINGTYNDLVISNAGVKTILTATTVNCQTITFNDAATLEIAGTGLFNILG